MQLQRLQLYVNRVKFQSFLSEKAFQNNRNIEITELGESDDVNETSEIRALSNK